MDEVVDLEGPLPSSDEAAFGLVLACLQIRKLSAPAAVAAAAVELAELYPQLTPLQAKLLCEHAAASVLGGAT